ncbi:hypothetical protein AMECASPLE_036643 [Ameca splendens]|uniref:Uncharacterized protein n=1 Tax=Ameca splendens TaxID=208324 RepID=A0ABV0YUT1_9TELE
MEILKIRRPTPQTVHCAPQTIHEPFLLCGTEWLLPLFHPLVLVDRGQCWDPDWPGAIQALMHNKLQQVSVRTKSFSNLSYSSSSVGLDQTSQLLLPTCTKNTVQHFSFSWTTFSASNTSTLTIQCSLPIP